MESNLISNPISSPTPNQTPNPTSASTPTLNPNPTPTPITSDIISLDIPLINVLLPDQWILYLYDKKVFKKMASDQNFQAEPNKKLCTISTVNDLMYILQLMKIKTVLKKNSSADSIPVSDIPNINLDMNDYIIMRKGIEPIWEDPRNKCSGTFSVKVSHKKGYDIWSTFVLYLLGETLTNDSSTINGISVSYISSDAYNSSPDIKKCYTFLKIWDGKPNRPSDKFVDILPAEILEKIKSKTTRYVLNDQKKGYSEDGIILKINKGRQNENSKPIRGGFNNSTNNYNANPNSGSSSNSNSNFNSRGRGRGNGNGNGRGRDQTQNQGRGRTRGGFW